MHYICLLEYPEVLAMKVLLWLFYDINVSSLCFGKITSMHPCKRDPRLHGCVTVDIGRQLTSEEWSVLDSTESEYSSAK